MASLQDQLLKAGLTTKQKARQANTDKRKKNKQKRSGVAVEQSIQEKVQQDLVKQKADKLAKDAELNAQKQQELAEKEQHQRVLQILQHHQVKGVDGEAEFNYTFNKVIKKLYINEKTHKALINGHLSLCGLDGQTYLVTTETAEKVATILPDTVLLKNEKIEQAGVEEDDPYAEFQIPDDLMW